MGHKQKQEPENLVKKHGFDRLMAAFLAVPPNRKKGKPEEPKPTEKKKRDPRK